MTAVAPPPIDHAGFKDALHETVRVGTLALAAEYYTRMAEPGVSNEDLRKGIEMGVRITGAEAEKKVDPRAGLMAVTFVIGRAGIQITAEPPPEPAPLELVEEVPYIEGAPLVTAEITTLRPLPVVQAPESMADDLLSMLP